MGGVGRRVPIWGSARRLRVSVAGVLVWALAAGLLPHGGAPAEAQPHQIEVERAAGSDRVATGIAVSSTNWDSASDVVLADAGNFPDALAAGALAASLDAPLLTTSSDGLDPRVAEEIQRLGATRVHLMGGVGALSEAVAEDLRSRDVEVVRLAGAGRFETAAAAAREAGPATSSGDVVLALGSAPEPSRAWPDALSGGAFAATEDRPPLLLVTGDALPAATADALGDLTGPNGTVHLLGGTGVVTPAVEDAVRALGHNVNRVAGPSRFATSTETATTVLRRFSAEPRPLVVASGANFPDGLSAGALAAHLNGVLLLVPPGRLGDAPVLGPWLRANGWRFDRLVVVGGAAAVSDEVGHAVAAELTAPLVELPELPAGSGDASAAVLMDRLADAADPAAGASSDESVGLIMAAATQAGMTVLDGHGRVAVAPPPGVTDHGLVLSAPEVVALALRPTSSTNLTLADLGSLIVEAFDDPAATGDIDAGEVLQEWLNLHADNVDSPLNGWVTALRAIGLRAEVPHDLLSDDPTTMPLTTIELTWIGRRLVADLLAALEEEQGGFATTRQASAGPPCAGVFDPGSIYSDIAAVALGAGSSLLSDQLKDALGGFVGKAANVLGITALVTAAASLTMTLAAYQHTVTYTGGSMEPLVRSRTTTPGEQRGVEVVVRNSDAFDAAVVLNCFRPIMNLFGLDLSVPRSGPLANVGVSYALPDQTVVVPYRNPADEALTDEQGAARWFIEGRGQASNLPEAVVPVDLQVPVDIGITLKTSDTAKNLTDAAGIVAAGVVGAATGGGWVSVAGILMTLVSELIQRTSLLTSSTHQLPVRDWVPGCAGPSDPGPSDPGPTDPGPTEPAPGNPCESADLSGILHVTDRTVHTSTTGNGQGEHVRQFTVRIAMADVYDGRGGDLVYYIDDGTTFDVSTSGAITYDDGGCVVTNRFEGGESGVPFDAISLVEEHGTDRLIMQLSGEHSSTVETEDSCGPSREQDGVAPLSFYCDPDGTTGEEIVALVPTRTVQHLDGEEVRTFDFACEEVLYEHSDSRRTVTVSGTATQRVPRSSG